MATKKNNTKKANNKPETKEEIVEIKEKENIEELVELTDEDTEEITNFLKDKGMDDEFINNVLNNEELENAVKAIMKAEQNKPSLKERFKKFASDKKEAIQNAAIVVGATAAICGVVYAVCNVADDDDSSTDTDPDWVKDWNEKAEIFNEHIDDWNNEWNNDHPGVNPSDSKELQMDYDAFIAGKEYDIYNKAEEA